MMGTRRRRLVLIGATTALFATGVALTLVAPLAARRAAGGITLSVSCVMKQQNHTYDATFGYENTTGAAQTIPLGASNHLTASAPNGHTPPTTFATGKDTSAIFVSNIPSGTTFGWVVVFGGVTSTATASPQSARCSSSSGPPTTTSTTTTTPTPPKAPPGPVDVGIVKTVSVPHAVVGQHVTYTLRITNHGAKTAVDVKAIDHLPAGLVLVHASIPHGTCTQARLVVCTVASLAPGRSVSARIVVRADASGPIENGAVVTAAQPETNMANNSSHAMLHVAKPKGNVAPAHVAIHAKPHFTG